MDKELANDYTALKHAAEARRTEQDEARALVDRTQNLASVMQTICALLQPLSVPARRRVLHAVAILLEIDL